jgi:hypothetical protein
MLILVNLASILIFNSSLIILKFYKLKKLNYFNNLFFDKFTSVIASLLYIILKENAVFFNSK